MGSLTCAFKKIKPLQYLKKYSLGYIATAPKLSHPKQQPPMPTETPRENPDLSWIIVRLGNDMNWWVQEISDDIHWEIDALSILDPRQVAHIIDLCEPLRVYGFDTNLLDKVFFGFRIEKILKGKDNHVRLVRTTASIIHSDEELFALPDVLDDERGPYADFLDQLTRFRVMHLNELIDFESNLTIDELDDEIRERQNADFHEGRSVHFFVEIASILEYVPTGFELDGEDEESRQSALSDGLEDIPEIPEVEERIEEDETMKWDETAEGTEEPS